MCVPDTEKQRNYISTLIRDIERFVEKYPEWKFYGFDIGGGTPTALDSEVFSELMIWYKHFIGERTVTDRFEPSIEGTFDSMVSDYQGYHKSRLIADKVPDVEYLAQSPGDNGYDVLNNGLFFRCSNKRCISVYDIVIMKPLS